MTECVGVGECTVEPCGAVVFASASLSLPSPPLVGVAVGEWATEPPGSLLLLLEACGTARPITEPARYVFPHTHSPDQPQIFMHTNQKQDP